MSQQKSRIPAQLMQWFESLKYGYEHSLDKLFNRVEKVNQEHNHQLKTTYQSQIDNLKDLHQQHIDSLKDNHQQQLQQSTLKITQYEQDAAFYQEQIRHQNQIIEKLNDRYDAVIFALKDSINHEQLAHVIKDISPNAPDQLTSLQTKPTTAALAVEQKPDASLAQNLDQESTVQCPTSLKTPSQSTSGPVIEPITAPTEESTATPTLTAAFMARDKQEFTLAYQLFHQLAILGDGKAMGAIARAYYVGEGVSVDKTVGLAWLIKAAEHQFVPAIKKVNTIQQSSPQLYQTAQQISQHLF